MSVYGDAKAEYEKECKEKGIDLTSEEDYIIYKDALMSLIEEDEGNSYYWEIAGEENYILFKETGTKMKIKVLEGYE